MSKKRSPRAVCSMTEGITRFDARFTSVIRLGSRPVAHPGRSWLRLDRREPFEKTLAGEPPFFAYSTTRDLALLRELKQCGHIYGQQFCCSSRIEDFRQRCRGKGGESGLKPRLLPLDDDASPRTFRVSSKFPQGLQPFWTVGVYVAGQQPRDQILLARGYSCSRTVQKPYLVGW